MPYFPEDIKEMNVVFILQKKVIKDQSGFSKQEWVDQFEFKGSLKGYGGSQKVINDLITIEETATVTTWYRKGITDDCRLIVKSTGATYDILYVENIDTRTRHMKIKVRRVKTGA